MIVMVMALFVMFIVPSLCMSVIMIAMNMIIVIVMIIISRHCWIDDLGEFIGPSRVWSGVDLGSTRRSFSMFFGPQGLVVGMVSNQVTTKHLKVTSRWPRAVVSIKPDTGTNEKVPYS